MIAAPRPIRNDRTGKRLIPSAWAVLASRVLDPGVPQERRLASAKALAKLVLEASEERGR